MDRVVGVILLAGVIAAVPPAHGQDGPQFGLTLGYNWATLESPSEVGTQTAFVGGLAVRQGLVGPLSIQSELLLNQKGAEVNGEEGGGIDYGAGYLEMPVLLHVKAPSIRMVTLHGEAGGFGGLKIFERQTPGSGNLNIPFQTETSFFRRFDAGVMAGVGATVSIRDWRLNFTVRHAWGLVDAARDIEDQPFSDAPFPSEGETRTWSLLLRFGF